MRFTIAGRALGTGFRQKTDLKMAEKGKKNLALHLISGGVAGCCEAIVCHPLDTIKVRLQLRGQQRQSFIRVGINIAKNEGFLSLYKGLGAVITGIVPKQSIRFASFDYYKSILGTDSGSIFLGY